MLDGRAGDAYPRRGGELSDIHPSLLPDLAERYTKERLVHLPGLISPGEAQQLLASTEYIPARRVWCGLEDVSWHEQTFEPGHPAHDFFEQEQAKELVMGLAGRESYLGLTSWTSIYSVGEYINPHRDAAGSIQLLLCLQSPPSPANGGELVVGGSRLFLRPGDAVVFEATALEHYTTPLVPTVEEANPRRTVLVGRYFLG